jgi:hypothetical protein
MRFWMRLRRVQSDPCLGVEERFRALRKLLMLTVDILSPGCSSRFGTSMPKARERPFHQFVPGQIVMVR